MNAIALTISNTPIRQDSLGRYCLNDLHKAAGGASKHQPAFFIRRDETKELVTELSSADSQNINPIQTIQGKGKAQGTYAVKELVYAYAMWISAKFHIAVIRAYDALVTGHVPYPHSVPKAPRAKFALSGGLTLEQQDLINDTIAERVATLPQELQARAVIGIRSSIVSKYDLKGIKHGYKNIPSDQFTNVLNLIARLELDGDQYVTLPKQELQARLEAQKALSGELLEKERAREVTIRGKDAIIEYVRSQGYVVMDKSAYIDQCVTVLVNGLHETQKAMKEKELNRG